MKGVLTCWDGKRLELPETVSWKMEYAGGVPCDSFTMQCLWEPGEDDALADAVRFTAEEDGERVFTGVVDEYEFGWDENGGKLTISGRSMAALLLDNEALGCDYQVATLEDILQDHVRPYGICVGETAKLPAVPGFSVATGSSEWQVLYEFTRYYGGMTPQFDRQGRLVILPQSNEKRRILQNDAAVTGLWYRQRRYGVLSEIWVRDRTDNTVQKMDYAPFKSRGGVCRRVLTMPGKSSYQAMRYSGEYQLQKAAEKWKQLELELPGAFQAWPGELVEVKLKQDTCRGIWRVAESVSGLDRQGTYTRLTLEEA